MRILLLAHRLPYPPHKGEKIRVYNVLKYLAKKHQVLVACVVDDRLDLKHVASLRSLASDVVFEPIHRKLRRAYRAPVALFGNRSITAACQFTRRLQRKVDDLIERGGIDAILCTSSGMAEYVFRSRHYRRLQSVRKVMDLIDVDSFKWMQYSQRHRGLMSWIYRREAQLLASLELRIAGEFDSLLVVSEQERKYFPQGPDTRKLSAMSNGVDLDFFSPGHSVQRSFPNPALVFTGVMDYWPNLDGVRWFIERIFPRVQDAVREVHFYVVGNKPPADVLRLGRRRGVVVTGFVDDVRDYLQGASACVVPLRVARGVQNKILEAMAMGRPVVTTPAAFEGLAAQPDRDLIVADGEVDFAAATIALLRDSERAQRIGRNARACVVNGYSWATKLRVLDELFLPESARPTETVTGNSARSPTPLEGKRQ